MKKITKVGETFRGAKGTYLINKGHIDKYELYLNEDYLQKNDDGELHFTFKFIQAFQFKKDLLKRIEEIEMEYIMSEEFLKSQVASGLMTEEEAQSRMTKSG
jgi:hypothetical protein